MKIFVAKLGFKTTSEDLRSLFERFGTVESARVIMDKDTNRSKCYGFVEMPIDSEAYMAIVETNETEYQGSVINVKKSKPQVEGAKHTDASRTKREYKTVAP